MAGPPAFVVVEDDSEVVRRRLCVLLQRGDDLEVDCIKRRIWHVSLVWTSLLAGSANIIDRLA